MESVLIKNIQAIHIESPVDKIIAQLKQLILKGDLKPGDKLPSERALSEMFQVGRSYIREAILKLEFYGLLKTSPQKRTYVAGLGINILENIISDIIQFNKDDFKSLVETRYHLEITAVKLAAQRRTENDVIEIANALLDYENKLKSSNNAIEEDMLFHIKIAKAAKNNLLESMILILIPDLIKNIVENNVCGTNRSQLSIPEHQNILKAIQAKDAAAAEEAMAAHLSDIVKISQEEAL